MEGCVGGVDFASLRVQNDVKRSVPLSGHRSALGIWVNSNSAVVTVRTARFNIQQILRSAHTVYLCVLYGSQNKQRLFPYTTLTDWFLYPRLCVYCAVRTGCVL